MPRVLVIGGGIGGLALAHGLRRRGIDVRVYERQQRDQRLDGFRLHLSPAASRALSECLPPELFRAILASGAEPPGGFVVLSERLRPLLRMRREWGDSGVDRDVFIGRTPLREVLLRGLIEDDVVRFGRSFDRYEMDGDEVVAHFADGTTDRADCLVGADGVFSRVRRQLVPAAEPVPTGLATIAAGVPLTDEIRSLLPPRPAFGGIGFVLGAGGRAAFLNVHDPGQAGEDGGDGGDRGDGAIREPAYLLWAFTARIERFPELTDVASMAGPRRHEVVTGMTERWHPNLRALIAAARSDDVRSFPFHTTAGPIPSWRPGPVTVLGDAIHPMPPTGGVGGSTALRDAALLAKRLADGPAVAAIGSYETEMRTYGYQAVVDSHRNLTWHTRLENPLAYTFATRIAMPLANKLSRR